MNTGCVTNACDLNLNLNSNYCNNVHCRGLDAVEIFQPSFSKSNDNIAHKEEMKHCAF